MGFTCGNRKQICLSLCNAKISFQLADSVFKLLLTFLVYAVNLSALDYDFA